VKDALLLAIAQSTVPANGALIVCALFGATDDELKVGVPEPFEMPPANITSALLTDIVPFPLDHV